MIDRDQLAASIYAAVVSVNAHARDVGGERCLLDAAAYATRAADALIKHLAGEQTVTLPDARLP